MPVMIALTDPQLKIVMDAAIALAPERRDIFLQRVGAMLNMRGRFLPPALRVDKVRKARRHDAGRWNPIH